MKKFLILVVMILTLSLCACGSSAESNSGEVTEETFEPDGNYIVATAYNQEEGTELDVSKLTDPEEIKNLRFELTILSDSGEYFEIMQNYKFSGKYERDGDIVTFYDKDGKEVKVMFYDEHENTFTWYFDPFTLTYKSI